MSSRIKVSELREQAAKPNPSQCDGGHRTAGSKPRVAEAKRFPKMKVCPLQLFPPTHP